MLAEARSRCVVSVYIQLICTEVFVHILQMTSFFTLANRHATAIASVLSVCLSGVTLKLLHK